MRKKLIGLLLGIAVLFTGCEINPESQEIFASPTKLLDPTKSESPLPTATVENTITPSTPPRSTPSSTAIPTYSTLMPTFTVEEENEKIFDLLKDNGGCDLPCIWGVYPDDIEHLAANQAFFQQFQDYTDDNRYEVGEGGAFRVYNQKIYFEKTDSEGMMQVDMFLKNHWYIFLSARYYPSGEGGYLQSFGSPAFNKLTRIYGIDSILQKYGRPTNVWIAAWRLSLTTKRKHEPYNIVLYYPDKGILVQYEGESEKSGNKLSLCPWETDIVLTTWNVSHAGPFTRELKGGSTYDFGQHENDFLPLEEVTATTMDEFYALFKDSDAKGCIVTSLDIWKGY